MKMDKVEFDDICCGKKMKHYPHLQTLMGGIQNQQMWLCLECGSYFSFEEGQYDEEELENWKNQEED